MQREPRLDGLHALFLDAEREPEPLEVPFGVDVVGEGAGVGEDQVAVLAVEAALVLLGRLGSEEGRKRLW
jgi:hypothetical protein